MYIYLLLVVRLRVVLSFFTHETNPIYYFIVISYFFLMYDLTIFCASLNKMEKSFKSTVKLFFCGKVLVKCLEWKVWMFQCFCFGSLDVERKAVSLLKLLV